MFYKGLIPLILKPTSSKRKKKVAFPYSQRSKHGHIDFTGFLRLIYHLKRGLILINDLILTFYFIFQTLFQSVFYRMKEQVGTNYQTFFSL